MNLISYSEKEIKSAQLIKKAKSDFYFFCKDILGYEEMRPKPHQELCDFVSKRQSKKKLILLPRGAFKSSVVTIGYSLFNLVNNPDVRILISSETYAQSVTYLQEIKNHIENNSKFKALFGDLKSEDLWRREAITISGGEIVKRKEPSVSVSGVGQVRVGMHYNRIVLDDVVSTNNINTSEQIEKIINHYKLLLSILEPMGTLIIIGTRYSYADLYGYLLENEPNSFDVLIRSAIEADGSLYFPSRLDKIFLAKQRYAQGSSIFANQYLNKVIDEDSAMFKQSWIQYFTEPPANLRHFLLIDPASSIAKTADYTGLIVAGIDSDSNIFILESLNLRITILDLVDKIFNYVMKYNIHEEGCLAIETNASQQTYKYIISEEMNKRKFYFSIKELKPDSRNSKARKIQALQPFFENGKIWIKKTHLQLIDQILRYPRTRHDDLIDAMAGVLQVMIPAEPTVEDEWSKSKLSENEKNVWINTYEAIKIAEKRMVKRRKHRI